MKDGIIIFSRFSSNRLFGKALLDIKGKPLLGRVIERVKCAGDYKIVVATSTNREDRKIVDYCKDINIDYFRGNLNNVLKRAVDCANYYGFKRFARICGDRPLLDYTLIHKYIHIHKSENLHLVTNTFPPTYPQGMTTEVISTKALSKINYVPLNQYQRENITSYFYKNSNYYRIKNLKYENGNLSKYKFSVDSNEDLKKINWIYDHLNENPLEINIRKITKIDEDWLKYNQ